MDARNFFDPGPGAPHLRQNLFGGSIGGPFVGNRNFYFANAEGTRANSARTRTANVPTALERTGDFSQSPVTIRDPFTQSAFSQNRIPAARISAIGAGLAKLYPLPNRNVVGQNYVSSPMETTNIGQVTGKMDFQAIESMPIFVRYSFINNDRAQPYSAQGPNFAGFGINVLDRGQNAAIGFTRYLSPTLFNDFRAGFSRLYREVSPRTRERNELGALGARVPDIPANDFGFPLALVTGYDKVGDDPNLPIRRRTGTVHLSNSLNWQHDRHLVKAGGEFRHYLSNGFTHLFARGQLLFTGALTGNGLADMLLGFPTVSILGTNNNYQALRTHSFSGYLQDDWKAGRSLTVNFGLRYEYNSPPVDAHDSVAIFDVQQLKIMPVGKNGVSRSGLNSDKNNFAPRVGLNWDLTGEGVLTLGAGYGIFYDTEALIGNSALYFNPPVFNINLFITGANLLGLSDPFPTGRGFSPAPSPITLDPNSRTAYAQQWNTGLRWKMLQNTTAEARYVGTVASKLLSKRSLNQPLPGPGDVDSRRPIAGFSNILLIESSAASNYHSLQLSTQTTATRGLSLLGAYTFSKSIDNASAFISSTGDDNSAQDSRDLRAERGLSNFDLRHRFSVAATYEFPNPTGADFLSGWQLSTILALQSGRPFTPRLSADNSNTGNVGGSGVYPHDRPNLLKNPELSNPTPEKFFDTSAFAVPQRYTFGSSGRNVVIGPSYASVDMSLLKDVIKIGDQGRIQVRAEVFNVLNHANFQLPQSFIDQPAFGSVLGAYAARQIQLAMRLNF